MFPGLQGFNVNCPSTQDLPLFLTSETTLRPRLQLQLSISIDSWLLRRWSIRESRKTGNLARYKASGSSIGYHYSRLREAPLASRLSIMVRFHKPRSKLYEWPRQNDLQLYQTFGFWLQRIGGIYTMKTTEIRHRTKWTAFSDYHSSFSDLNKSHNVHEREIHKSQLLAGTELIQNTRRTQEKECVLDLLCSSRTEVHI